MKLTFENWMKDLRHIAKERECEYLLSENDEDHREAFEGGLSPNDEINEQYVTACQACA